MIKRPIGYVMEQTLGNITHYLNLRRGEMSGHADARRWIPIEFEHGRLPWTVRGSLIARRTLAPQLEDLDGVFVHTMTLSPACADLFAKKPFVISSDGPPAAKEQMRSAYGDAPQQRWSAIAKRELYRNIFRRAAGFVAWSQWAKDSFVRDYGCRDQDVAVVSPGVDLEQFVPGDRDHPLPRILFVGGDFVRKGGDLLLQVFRKHLRGKAELIFVTRDQAVQEEPGVTVHRNVNANSAELRALYATSDIFALPTRADCYSLVCLEALSAGLPIVTTRVGGIPDMVTEGKTGHLLEMDDEAALTQALRSLTSDAGKRREMAALARADAVARFDTQRTANELFEFVRSRC